MWRPQSGNSDLISHRQSRSLVPGTESRKRSPAKHLFGLDRVGQSPARAEPHRTFQRRDRTPRHGPETHGSQPRGYPFKLMTAAVSPAGTGPWTAPVLGGLASGADAPKSLALCGYGRRPGCLGAAGSAILLPLPRRIGPRWEATRAPSEGWSTAGRAPKILRGPSRLLAGPALPEPASKR